VDSEEITSQQDLEALQNDCTILLSSYRVTHEFSGPFVLPGIVNISTLSAGTAGSPEPFDVPLFEMPDLEYAKGLLLQRMDSVETFSVPKLMSLGWATLYIPSHIDVLEMPALEASGSLTLRGNFTE
jgi:hypothetical protein